MRIRAPLTVLLVVGCLLAPTTAHARPHRLCSHACVKRVAKRQCSQTNVRACLLYASMRWHVSYRLIVSIAWCESRLNPYAYNRSGATGLLQWMSASWNATPYARHRRTSARWSSLAGAWALRHVGTGPWTASRPCWG